MEKSEFIEVVSDLQDRLEQAKGQASEGQLTGEERSTVLSSLSNLDSEITQLTTHLGYVRPATPREDTPSPGGPPDSCSNAPSSAKLTGNVNNHLESVSTKRKA